MESAPSTVVAQLPSSRAHTGGEVRLFDVDTFDLLTAFAGQAAAASDIVFSADGRLMVTREIAEVSTARLWDVEAGVPIGSSFGPSPGAPALAPDGSFLVIANEDGVTRWSLNPDVWREQACVAAGRNLTRAEWAEFLPPEQPYRATCEQWPIEEPSSEA